MCADVVTQQAHSLHLCLWMWSFSSGSVCGRDLMEICSLTPTRESLMG